MVWLMTAFHKRSFINLKAAHLHLNPCVENWHNYFLSHSRAGASQELDRCLQTDNAEQEPCVCSGE